MCLAVPGKLIQIRKEEGATSMGRVDFGGVVKEVCLSYLPEAKIGDYVMTHAGFAISRVEESEAREVFEMLAEIDEALGAGAVAAEGTPPSAAEGAVERKGAAACGDASPSTAQAPGEAQPSAKTSDSDALR